MDRNELERNKRLAKIIDGAADLIDDPDHWRQGVWGACRASGPLGISGESAFEGDEDLSSDHPEFAEANSPAAVRWCGGAS